MHRRAVIALLAIGLMVNACGLRTSTPTDSATPAANALAAQATKTLRIGLQREPDGLLRPGSTGQMLALWLVNDDLTVPNEQGKMEPRLAAEIPSLQNGDWVVNPDGSMVVTWKLRP